MLTGLLLGSLAAFVWSLTNIVDKYLTHKHASDGNVWGILILSCLFPGALLPIAYYYAQNPIIISPDVLPLFFSGVLMVAWIYFYLKALSEEDTSVVMTLLVLAPVFGLLFGHIFLDEVITINQLLASSLIISGALIISYKKSDASIPFIKRYNVIFYALAASSIIGLMLTLFKGGTYESDVWYSIFWRSTGMVTTGLLLCFFIPKIQDRFLDLISGYSKSTLGLNTLNESFTLIGDVLFGFAILFAPIMIIQTTESYQPFFIIIITFILGQIGISSVQEKYDSKTLFLRLSSIALVCIGSILLVFNS
jgi:uncharacterized membrane protein